MQKRDRGEILSARCFGDVGRAGSTANKETAMAKIVLVLVVSIAAGMAIATSAFSAAMSKDAYKTNLQRVDAAYKAAKDQCKPLTGNARDVCMAEAKGRQKVGKADAEAEYKGTTKARTAARNARADADFAVAKEKCDDLAGNAKDVCRKEANAAHVSALADAKADRRISDARNTAAKTTNEARRDAGDDKRDAEYKVALERCDGYAGDAKSRCVKDAKARFGKS
jgi:hypothetical protein